MPKKGLMAMAGRISAPGSAGRGAIHTPPVSVGKKDEIIHNLLNLQWLITHDISGLKKTY